LADFGRGREAIISQELKRMLFRLLIDLEALAVLNGLPAKRRRRALDHLRNIQNFWQLFN
jgi:hypothetical protein